jgi:enamine deaminase RidA (YjgF/YER057c/UK114 family)
MTGRIKKRLEELGLELPPPTIPQGSYTPFVRSGNQVFVAGQGPRLNGKMIYEGSVGETLSVEDGIQAARICGLNLISQVAQCCDNDLDRVVRVIRLAGVVRSPASFTLHAQVMNGASDLMRDVFGDRGIHARMATGAVSLPSGMAVEVEGIFEIEA